MSEKASTSQVGAKPRPVTCAFISHSRANAHLAKRLAIRINTYRPPRAADLGGHRLRAFLDVEGLTVGDSLPKRLRNEVLNSDFFVLLATPAAAASKWVGEETKTFVETKGTGSVLPVLVEGTPQTAFPPALAVTEPLFLDLSYERKWLIGARRFRLDVLRLIAALYRVEYRRLRRENERRRRFRILCTVAILGFASLAFTAAYMVSRVPQRGWEIVVQPDSGNDEPLLPITQVAVNRSAPLKVIWRGKNASWVEAAPDAHGRFELQEPGAEQPSWLNRWTEELLENAVIEEENRLTPLLQFEFRFQHFREEEEWGRVRYRIHGYRHGDDVHYFRELEGERMGAESDAGEPMYVVPAPVPADGFTLWSTKEIEIWGFPVEDSRIQAVLTRPPGEDPREIQALWWSPEEGIPEANEIRREYVVFGNFEFDSIQDRPDEWDHNWEDVVDDRDWATFQPPEGISIGLRHPGDGHSRASDETLRYLKQEVSAFPGLATLLGAELTWAEFLTHQLRILYRDGQGLAVAAVSTSPEDTDEPAGSVRRVQHYVSVEGAGWQDLILNGAVGQVLVTDVMEVKLRRPAKFIVTQSQGIFYFDETTARWIDGNFGNYQLHSGGPIYLIKTPGTLHAHVTSATIGEKANPLFLLRERSLWQRLVLSLQGERRM